MKWSEISPWRPFCSERCKLVDLGDWASEQHAIPDDDTASTPTDGDAADDDQKQRS